MKRYLIPLLVALTAAWSVPAPARASDTDTVVGLLAGLVTLGLIAKAIDERNDREKAAVAATRNADRFPPAQYERLGRLGAARSALLPDACLRRFDGLHDGRLGYGRQCLKRQYDYADSLPRSCERKIRTDRGLRTVYAARCLERAGYRVEARRGN